MASVSVFVSINVIYRNDDREIVTVWYGYTCKTPTSFFTKCTLITGNTMRHQQHYRICGVFKQFCRTKSTTQPETRAAQIKQHTVLSRDHMTPEVALYLITRDCPLWSGKADDNTPFIDPFWAFYWPGGQVMTRYRRISS